MWTSLTRHYCFSLDLILDLAVYSNIIILSLSLPISLSAPFPTHISLIQTHTHTHTQCSQPLKSYENSLLISAKGNRKASLWAKERGRKSSEGPLTCRLQPGFPVFAQMLTGHCHPLQGTRRQSTMWLNPKLLPNHLLTFLDGTVEFWAKRWHIYFIENYLLLVNTLAFIYGNLGTY